jgi:hypothetical protein
VRKLCELIQNKPHCCLVTLERMGHCELCERFQRGYLFFRPSLVMVIDDLSSAIRAFSKVNGSFTGSRGD